MNESPLCIVPVDDIPRGEPCPTDDLVSLYNTCLKLEELCAQEHGMGLSAVQVGIPWQLFVICAPDKTYRYFLNCEYRSLKDKRSSSLEGCLSLRDEEGNLRYFEVSRYDEIRLSGKELVTEPELKVVDVRLEADDFYSILYQHEIDHQNGILISDIGKEYSLWDWD